MIVYTMEPVVCQESYGSQRNVKYLQASGGQLQKLQFTQKFQSVSQFFRDVFLPQGYPESVSDDYLEYQIWDTVQAFASSITGTLATQAVLKGVGVGDKSATVLAATMTWLIKDGTSMVGRIVFAWFQGISLDCDCKRWRLFADMLNDFAIFLEILAPAFNAYFTLIVSVSGLCKSVVGVAGGATWAALTQHQARRDNMADVSAKDGSQETLVNLAALLCSLAVIHIVTGHQVLIWTLFILFTSLHLFANYRAVSVVKMETFNQARLHIVSHHYLSTRNKEILSVKEANSQEPLVFKIKKTFGIHLGCSFSKVAFSIEELKSLVHIYSGCKYLLNYTNKGDIHIALHKGSTAGDQLEASFHANFIEHVEKTSSFNQFEKPSTLYQNIFHAYQAGDKMGFLELSRRFVEETYHHFAYAAQRAGWDTSRVLLCADEWRSVWDIHGLPDKKDF